MRFVLASGSPRRRELLGKVLSCFEVVAAHVDENISYTSPVDLVERLSLIKAQAVARLMPQCIVIGADTVVEFCAKVLNKPENTQQAVEMLSMLSGKRHNVFTGVSLVCGQKQLTFVESSVVTFKQLSLQQIMDYIATDSPFDKAGGYGVQDSGFVSDIIGSRDNVVGLPTQALQQNLQQFIKNL